ncbi:hypothetical protein TNCV_332261 [Trichonephila clavipes]|nr:hypothetical protein TNCV_332261 [Trichonephila clavipes]
MQFCVYIDNVIDGIDTYDFRIQKRARINTRSKRTNSRKKLEPKKELAEFVPVPSKKQKNKLHSPTKDDSSAKKPRTSVENKYEALTLEEPTTAQNDDEMEEEIIPASRTSTPIPKVRPPPPITIDGIAQPAQFLKRSRTSLAKN